MTYFLLALIVGAVLGLAFWARISENRLAMWLAESLGLLAGGVSLYAFLYGAPERMPNSEAPVIVARDDTATESTPNPQAMGSSAEAFEREVTLLGAPGLIVTLAFETLQGQNDESFRNGAVPTVYLVRELIEGYNVGYPIDASLDLSDVGRICAYVNEEPLRLDCKLPPFEPTGDHNSVATLSIPTSAKPKSIVGGWPAYIYPDCSWVGLLNKRTTEGGHAGLGMSLCPDDTIYNGDGLRVGNVTAKTGDLITVNWHASPGTEEFSVKSW